MIDDKVFFTTVRSRLFGRLDGSQVDGLNAILSTYRLYFTSSVSLSQLAYCLATAYHETGGKMQPVLENLNYRDGAAIQRTWPKRFPTVASAEPYARNPRALANKVYNGRMGNALGSDDGWIYRGAGLPQITGKENFARATVELRAIGILGPDESLVETPSLALRPDVTVACLLIGMRDGWFTSRRLRHTIPEGVASREAYRNSRPIINGTDKADKIAGEAMVFQAALGVTA